ncbi:hypothetical protein MYCTH_2302609 [Thermothelomyces thermophilus ATCC 42464]|uniref:FHA domain-containing protein n=1 Tax=Thermothelomyces thermophilus (strain ATCC 42464 / BCRC 31852 / DSM 1799) TaxID=573729 RepID=G2Q824_THET4|nr:uncharacterized protein MYCTH_2302609 [Thermothelomyces thermophilus ATCC 42464]AEO56981.1 hypothetical protein MYCTH_2302609 [Thermothelomyces thermophilus ATCC 42464]
MSAATSSNKTVVLSLSTDPSSGSDVLFPERRIVFHQGKDNIIVGRASKVSVKGYVAGIENAWFYSPVMSRHHAQIFARMDCNKVEIKDLGSLHGTFLNGDERISADEFRELKDGDVLRFGAPIWRGVEQFVPTTVKVGLEFPNQDGTSTFQVPDESDDDDDDGSDVDQSSNDENMKLGTNARHLTTPGGFAPSNAAVVPSIDLTGSDAGHQSRQVIDLSTPRGSPIPIDENEGTTSFSERKIDQTEDAADNQATSFELGGLADREKSRDRTDTPASMVDHHHDRSRPAWGSSPSSDSVDFSPRLRIVSFDESDEELESERSACSETTSDEGMDGSDDLDDLNSSESVHDSEGDFGDHPSDDGGFGFESDNSMDTDHPQHDWGNLPQSTEFLDFPEIEPLVKSLSRGPVALAQGQTATGGNGVVSIDLLLNSDKPQSPIAVHAGDPSTSAPGTKTAEILGARTGKMDYFLAREENRTTLMTQKAVATRLPSVRDLCNNDEPMDGLKDHQFNPAAHITSPFSQSQSGHVGHRTTYSPGEPHIIGSPVSLVEGLDEHSRRTHVGISDIVNTSQADHSEVASHKKTEISFPTPPPVEETQPHSSQCNRERTQTAGEPRAVSAAQADEDSQPPNRGEGKRKADEISSATQEEEEWAAVTAQATQSESPLRQGGAINQHVRTSDQAGRHPSNSVSYERSTKRARMMRIAERLGYAALGGVTAGAMIVGTLIYTAPTFS